MSTQDCPRCGYDLSGEIETWVQACPVRGVCTECGLTFGWGEVLHPSKRVPRWAVEHPMGFSVRRGASSFARVFWPWSYWDGVRIEQPIMLRPLALFCVLCYAVMHACMGLVGTGVEYIDRVGFNSRGFDERAMAASLVQMLVPYRLPVYGGVAEAMVVLLTLFSVAAALPLGFLALGQTMARAKVRYAHVARVFVLTLPIPAWGSTVAVGLLYGDLAGWTNADMALIAMAAMMIIHAVTWWVVVRTYLRLEHPTAVSIAMTAIAWLSGLIAMLWSGFLF